MGLDKDLFIDKIILEKDRIESFDKYPFNIDIIKNLDELQLNSRVTFLVGENGIGKSTFIEALAVACRLNPEGGTQNINFSTRDTHSNLSEYIRIISSGDVPRTKFFLRAESFYNFSSEVQRLAEEDGFASLYSSYGGNLHECSHGEAFINLISNRFSEHGLYILDEPEAALSPTRQMSLLCMIDELAKKGSQFIIATHSPILISYRDGEILDLNDNFKKVEYQDTDIYQTYMMYLSDPLEMQKRLFDN